MEIKMTWLYKMNNGNKTEKPLERSHEDHKKKMRDLYQWATHLEWMWKKNRSVWWIRLYKRYFLWHCSFLYRHSLYFFVLLLGGWPLALICPFYKAHFLLTMRLLCIIVIFIDFFSLFFQQWDLFFAFVMLSKRTQ